MSKIWDIEFQEWRKKLLGSESNNRESKAASRDWMSYQLIISIAINLIGLAFL